MTTHLSEGGGGGGGGDLVSFHPLPIDFSPPLLLGGAIAEACRVMSTGELCELCVQGCVCRAVCVQGCVCAGLCV